MFSLIDALSQSPLFLGLVDGIVGIIDAISEFVGLNPGITKTGLAIGGIGIAAGTALETIGTLSLGLNSLFGEKGLIREALPHVRNLKKAFANWQTGAIVAAAIAIAVLAFYGEYMNNPV